MKTLRIILAAFSIVVFGFAASSANAKTITGTNTADLNTQIVQEIKDVLQTPYLKFADKDLNGIVKIAVNIKENGKITFKKLSGENENLSSNVIEKLNSLNLWTSPDYQKNSFSYLIRYKN